MFEPRFRLKNFALLGWALMGWLTARAASPMIEITNVPAFGSSDLLKGRVSGVAPAEHRVAVFIYVPSAGWWSKPYCSPQLTPVNPDGSWVANIATAPTDKGATKITALLVRSNYNEPCVEGPPSLPSNVLTQSLAQATVTRADPDRRRISFAGYDWWVKTSEGPVGPGPNVFSDSTNNVWVDSGGRLHMRITNRSNQWQCAEIVSERSFGYGSYRFELDSSVSALNLNAVLGLFTWSDDEAFVHREIDIECSRWGVASDNNNSQFVIQPWNAPGHLKRYSVPAAATNSTHWFTWESNRVVYGAVRGNYTSAPPASVVISNWVCAAGVPQPGDENVRINLWLFYGSPPVGNTEVEFVIRSFSFVPPGAPQPASLTNLHRLPGGQLQLEIHGHQDRWYAVQQSPDLREWQDVAQVLSTNGVARFECDQGLDPSRYFRAVTQP